tara:strand:+ start:1238 stop:1480 length:243 start_codon:yes stop_codon:yes gene_type:complete
MKQTAEHRAKIAAGMRKYHKKCMLGNVFLTSAKTPERKKSLLAWYKTGPKPAKSLVKEFKKKGLKVSKSRRVVGEMTPQL